MIIAEIERLMEQQVDVLLDPLAGPMILSLKTRSKKTENSRTLTAQPSFATRLYRFPGRSRMEAWRFSAYIPSRSTFTDISLAVVFRLLIMIHEALVSDAVFTKR
jgi:hypothetical protein